MNNQELLDIRQQILDSALPLILESEAAPEERFELLLRFIRFNAASSDLYKKAYEAALSFANSDEKLDALLQLLSEVDEKLDVDSVDSEEEPSIEDQVAKVEEPNTVSQV